MTPRLRSALVDHFARFRLATYNGEQSVWVFHHTRTIRSAVAGQPIKTLRGGLLKAATNAGVPTGFVPHDLRHRRATTWIADEKNLHHVQTAMEHSVIATTLGYTHLAKQHLRSLVDEPGTSALDAANR